MKNIPYPVRRNRVGYLTKDKSPVSEGDVARGTGVQPYRFEPRNRSNSGDEESTAGELIRESRTFRFLDVSPRTVIGAVMGGVWCGGLGAKTDKRVPGRV